MSKVYSQKRLFDPNYFKRSPLRNSTEKLNVSGYYSPNYYRPQSHGLQNTFLKGKQVNSFQHPEPYQRNFDQPEKKRFQLSDMFQLRPQSPTIFTKKRSYAEQNISSGVGSRNQSPYSYGMFQSPVEQPKRVLIKNASEYLPSKRPISGEMQWQKPELNVQRNTKFEIERLRMELEQYKLSKRNSNSSMSKINIYRDTRDNNKNVDNYKPIGNYQPYIRNQERNIEQPKLSPEKRVMAKKQPFQLSSQLKESDRRQTPEGNRVDQLRKQLYSTYKSDRELFFESLNKSTPYNKIANQRELQQSFRDQIKYNLDKKFI